MQQSPQEAKEREIKENKSAPPWPWYISRLERIGLKHEESLIRAHPEYAEQIVDAFVHLHPLGILTGNREAILERLPYISAIGRAFHRLYIHRRLREYRDIILVFPQHATTISNAVLILNDSNILETTRGLILKIINSQHIERLEDVAKNLVKIRSLLLTEEACNAIFPEAIHAVRFLNAFAILQREDLLNEQNRGYLLAHSAHATGLAQGFATLQREGLLDEQTRGYLLAHAAHAAELAQAFATLQREGLLNEQTRGYLLAHAAHAAELAQAFAILQREGLLNEQNRNDVLAHAAHAAELAQVFIVLQREGLLNEQNRDHLLAHAAHAAELAQAFAILQQGGLLDEQTRGHLLAHIAHAAGLVRAFTILQDGQYHGHSRVQRVNLLTAPNRDSLLAHPAHAVTLATALQALGPGLSTPENRAVLIAHPEHAVTLAIAFQALGPELSTPENRAVLIAHPEYAITLADTFQILQENHLLTSPRSVLYRSVLLEHPEQAAELRNALGLLNERYHSRLVEHLGYARGIYEACLILDEARLLEDNYVEIILENPQYIENYVEAFKRLLSDQGNNGNLLRTSLPGLLRNPLFTKQLSNAFVKLSKAELLNEENREALLEHKENAESVAIAFELLNKRRILSKENRFAILQYADRAEELAEVFVLLNHANLLSLANRDALSMAVDNIENVKAALSKLRSYNLLRQENFDTILQDPANAALNANKLIQASIQSSESSAPVSTANNWGNFSWSNFSDKESETKESKRYGNGALLDDWGADPFGVINHTEVDGSPQDDEGSSDNRERKGDKLETEVVSTVLPEHSHASPSLPPVSPLMSNIESSSSLTNTNTLPVSLTDNPSSLFNPPSSANLLSSTTRQSSISSSFSASTPSAGDSKVSNCPKPFRTGPLFNNPLNEENENSTTPAKKI